MYTDFNYLIDQQQLSVGTSATPLPSINSTSKINNPERIHLQALTTNTASIFIAASNTVTSTGSTGGFEIPPGGNIILPVRAIGIWFTISSIAGQKLQINYLAR